MKQENRVGGLQVAGGRALIPKNAFGVALDKSEGVVKRHFFSSMR